MKVVDLHPEELLDKDARGALSEEERALLQAHLARCETCRFEQAVRADFALERSEGLGLSAHRLALLVDVGVRERSSRSEAIGARASAPRGAPSPSMAPPSIASPSHARLLRVPPSLVRAAPFLAVVLLACGLVGAAKLGLDGWGSSSGEIPSIGPGGSSGIARSPAEPTPALPVAEPSFSALGVVRADPDDPAPSSAFVDDEAFFSIDSFDEALGDILDEILSPSVFEPDEIP